MANLIGIVLGVIAFCVLASMWLTGLWYCFDDRLASLTGISDLGNLNFFHVWPATIFLSGIFKSVHTNTNKTS